MTEASKTQPLKSAPLGSGERSSSKRVSRRTSRLSSMGETARKASVVSGIFDALSSKRSSGLSVAKRPLSTKLAQRISTKMGLSGPKAPMYKPKPEDAVDDEVEVDSATYARLLNELNLEVVRMESGADDVRVPESMEDALENLRTPFRAFLKTKLAGENLFFLETIEAFEQISLLAQALITNECGDSEEDQKVARAARQIIEDKGMEIKKKFFEENAVQQVNLSAKLNSAILATEEKDFNSETFANAREEISSLMEVNFFDSFCEFMEKKQRESTKSTKSVQAPLPIFSSKAKKKAPLPKAQWRSEEELAFAPKPMKSNRTKSWKAPLPPSAPPS